MPESSTVCTITEAEIRGLVDAATRHRWKTNAIKYMTHTPAYKQRWDEYQRILAGGDPPVYKPEGQSISDVIAEKLIAAIGVQRAEMLFTGESDEDEDKPRPVLRAEIDAAFARKDLRRLRVLTEEMWSTIRDQDGEINRLHGMQGD